MDTGRGLVFALRIARILGEPSDQTGPRELVPLPLAVICAVFLLVLLPVPQLFAGLRGAMQTQTDHLRSLSAGVSSGPCTIDLPPLLYRTLYSKFCCTPAPPMAHAVANMVPRQWQPRLPKVRERRRRRCGIWRWGWSGGSAGNADRAPAVDASAHKPDYIDGMRAAGYDVDIDKYVAMKVQGITPEYAQEMAKVGFGKPSADDLIAMKVQGVTPEYVSQSAFCGNTTKQHQ